MSNSSKKINWRSFANFLAFVALVLVGLALIVSQLPFIKNAEFAGALTTVAQVLSYALVSYFAFLYAKSKRHWVFVVVWIVAIALIVISFVL